MPLVWCVIYVHVVRTLYTCCSLSKVTVRLSSQIDSELSYNRLPVDQSVLASGHHLVPAIKFPFIFLKIIFRQLLVC
jgi:hypothetical protein